MGMKIQKREAGDVVILDLKGQITLGAGDEKLKATIDEIIAAGKKQILLNVKKVSFMDSSGVGELVGCFTTVKREGGVLKLVHLSDKVQDILQITQLISVFEIYEDEAVAVKSFAG